MKTFPFILFMFLALISCDKHSGHSKMVKGYWGHNTSASSVSPELKALLGHVKKNMTYKICLANYMVKEHPGIENELRAAINIWGHYIGRKINISMTKLDLPETELTGPHPGKNFYYPLCPPGTDLVVARLAPSDASEVGQTVLRYDNKKFSRALFLRQPHKDQNGWLTLSEALNKELTEDEIIEIYKKRDQTIYIKENKLLTMQTILHEMGHVWGLCDQYRLDTESGTNCDPNFASINEEGHIILHDEATMAATHWHPNLYLSDDDIEGIRQLAERDSFVHDWKKEVREIPVNEISGPPPIAFVHIKKSSYDGHLFTIDMMLVTHAPIKVKMRFWNTVKNAWINFENSFSIPDSAEIFSFHYSLRMDRDYPFSKVELTYEVNETGAKDDSRVIKVENILRVPVDTDEHQQENE